MKLKRRISVALALLCATSMLLSGCNSDSDKPSATESGSNAATTEKDNADAAANGDKFSVTKGNGNGGNSGTVTLEKGDTYAVISIENYGDIKVKLYPEEVPYGVQNFIDLANSGYYSGKSVHRVIDGFMMQGGSLNGDGTGGTAADGGEFSCEINTDMRHYYGALCYANAGGSNTCQFYIVNNKEPQREISTMYDQYANYYSQYGNAFKQEAEKYDKGSDYYNVYMANGEAYTNMANGASAMSETLTDEISAKYAEVGGTPFLDGGYTVFGQTVEGFEVIDAISKVKTEIGSDGAESQPVDNIIIASVAIYTVE